MSDDNQQGEIPEKENKTDSGEGAKKEPSFFNEDKQRLMQIVQTEWDAAAEGSEKKWGRLAGLTESAAGDFATFCLNRPDQRTQLPPHELLELFIGKSRDGSVRKLFEFEFPDPAHFEDWDQALYFAKQRTTPMREDAKDFLRWLSSQVANNTGEQRTVGNYSVSLHPHSEQPEGAVLLTVKPRNDALPDSS